MGHSGFIRPRQTIYYKTIKGYVPNYGTLYKAEVTGPYVDIIGHNGAGETISDAVDNLKRHLNTIGYPDVQLLWDDETT